MTTLSDGEQLPEFEVSATSGLTLKRADFHGHYSVIYFYPKDNTPGCTQEGQEFRDAYARFQEAGCAIFGVSRDSLRKHENFKAKHGFPFELISDADEAFCQIFDVIKLKKLYGREYLGIERSTFLIDADGRLVKSWRKVRVKGHVDAVLTALSTLVSSS